MCVQSRVNRNTLAGGSGERGLPWTEFKTWIRDATVESLVEVGSPEKSSGSIVKYGAARKKAKTTDQLTSPVSGHNLKRNCRYQKPATSEAAFTSPAIHCGLLV